MTVGLRRSLADAAAETPFSVLLSTDIYPSLRLGAIASNCIGSTPIHSYIRRDMYFRFCG